jgi:hypothetical protein
MTLRTLAVVIGVTTGAGAAVLGADVRAARFAENPLITVASPSVGDNTDGPAVIRVPD